MNATSGRTYQAGDWRDIEVHVHRAGAIGELHVPTGSIIFDEEWKDPGPNVTLEELAAKFDGEARVIFEALVSCLPGGTLDRLIGKLLVYKASHFIVNHETPRASSEEMVKALLAVKASSEWPTMEAETQALIEHALDWSWK